MLVLFEIKKYAQEYRRILFGILSSALTCVLIYAGVNVLLTRGQLFEPFSVGLVDNDGTPEIRFVFDFFGDAVDIEYMDKAEAEARLAAGDIPAYAELPPRFASDILSGVNTPFYLYRNADYPLQGALSKLLATGGVAFLSSSQAGIYATLDYAAAHGLSREFTDRYILYPINIAFVKRLLDYEAFFDVQVLPLAEGDMHPAAQYVINFITFLFMVSMLSFSRALNGYHRAVYARFRLAGQPFIKIQWVRLAGIGIVNTLWITPLYTAAAYLSGSGFQLWAALSGGLALALCVGTFGLMAAALFKNDTVCGLFIFIVALAMLFVSGGIIPLAYLPRAVHGLRFASLTYWAAADAAPVSGAGVLTAFAVAFFGVMCVAEFLRLRFPRAV